MIFEQLEYFSNLVNELKNNNSSIQKKEILNKYYLQNIDLFNKFADYIYSYDKKYWITSGNVEKLKDKFSQKNYFSANDDLFKILDKLINREITGHGSINYINDLINFVGDKYKDEIYYIINKDLKANVNVSLINKISPNSVKEFKVALAERNDEAPQIHQVDFAKGSWMISRKIDGVRVLSLLNNGEVEFYSRTGAQFQTLSTLKEQTKKILNLAKDRHNDDFVLDGECCLIDEDGKDDFSGMMKQITKKNYTVLNPKYIIFDFIKKSEFDSASGKTIFKERMKMLEDLNIESLGNCIQLIPHQNSITKNDYEKWIKHSKDKAWEGLMLRDENSVYTGKRSFDLQKIKSFYDAEYKVIGLEEGKKKMLVNGIMQETNCIKSLVIEHKGKHMNVGSGISDEERVLWYKNPKLILNKIITVQYFEESTDSKTGDLSLRFPTLKIVHGEEREV
ncbi:MAG: hypothetical protein LBS95_00430 [Mycoplasmataceae bacterium]|nr:hypothetical protein [Mycoplasmataceae bacterium]